MKKFHAILPIALFAIAVSAADAPAPPTQPPPSDNKNPDALKQGVETMHYRQRVVTGKVSDMKETDVAAEGKTENHMLAKVTTYHDRVVIVDLGPRNALKTEIKTGDEIAAFGITGRLNQLPLIMASKVATIVPIEGREEIYESIPVDYQPSDAANSSQRLSQEAMRKSNDNALGNPRTVSPPPFLRECEDR